MQTQQSSATSQSYVNNGVTSVIAQMEQQPHFDPMLIQTNPQMAQQQLDQRVDAINNLNVEQELVRMTNHRNSQMTTTSHALKDFNEQERQEILSKSRAITDYVMKYNPQNDGATYLLEVPRGAEEANNHIMNRINNKSEVLQKTLSDFNKINNSPEYNNAVSTITEIMNRNQGSSTLSSKINRFLRKIPIIGQMLAGKVTPMIEEYQNGKKTLDQVLNEIYQIFVREEKILEADIARLMQVRDDLALAKEELRKQVAILKTTIDEIESRLVHATPEQQDAIRKFVLMDLSSQLNINVQKIGISAQYIIAIETGMDGNRILRTTSRETREIGVFAIRLSMLFDDSLEKQKKAIQNQQQLRSATDAILRENAKKFEQNVNEIGRLATTNTLNAETYRFTTEKVIAAYEKMSEIKGTIYQHNMKAFDEIMTIERELQSRTNEENQKRVKEGFNAMYQKSSGTTGGETVKQTSNSPNMTNLFS